MRDLLVTGTDTGVGKTMVATALIAALRARGVRVIGFKPVETGVVPGEEADSALLARASEDRNDLARPLLQLHEPLAPAVAAERAGATLNTDAIEGRIAQLRRDGYTLVVEGAGGVMVPLTWAYTVLDLAQACSLDAVIVARAGLGTLNHIAMTVMMLRSREIAIRGVVLNGRKSNPDTAELTNPSALARMVHGIRIVEIPHHPIGSTEAGPQAIAAIDRLL